MMISMSFNNVTPIEVIVHIILAGMGGIVREITSSEEEGKKTLWRYTAEAFVGMFCGLVIFFICKEYGISDILTAACTSIAGFMGTPVLTTALRAVNLLAGAKFTFPTTPPSAPKEKD